MQTGASQYSGTSNAAVPRHPQESRALQTLHGRAGLTGSSCRYSVLLRARLGQPYMRVATWAGEVGGHPVPSQVHNWQPTKTCASMCCGTTALLTSGGGCVTHI